MLRVCVVREILRVEDWACSGWRSKPSAESPTAPAAPVFRKERRESSMQMSPGVLDNTLGCTSCCSGKPLDCTRKYTRQREGVNQNEEVNVNARLKSQQVWGDLGVAAIDCPHIEYRECGLIDERNGQAIHRHVDGLKIATAGVARLDVNRGPLLG